MNPLKPGCFALFLLAVVSTHALGQQKKNTREHPAPTKLAATADRIIEAFMREKRVPGLVLAVLRDGNIVVEKGYGRRSASDATRPDADTLFYIGSLSKAVTGVGVELLAERGKLNIDEPAARYVEKLPKSWRHIPLKFFLAHQSGIPQIATAREPTFEQMLRTLDGQPLSFRPGAKQEYNNFNFALAGQVIEAASGRPYLTFMHDEVFKPLGMTRSGYGQTDANSAPGHYVRGNGWEEVNEVVPNGGEYGIPSGFLQTTLGDLLRLYRGIRQHKLLPAARTREMLSPVTPGLTGTPGWFAREVNGVTIVAKDGAASGYSSQFQFVKDRGDAVIFIMNLQGKALGTHALANDLLREVCGLPIPARHPKQDDSE
jgi:CubicO group peptidase (beta-lactamase class C family)